MDLGKLLNQEKKFGKVDFNVELKGFNYKNRYPESYIKGIISSFEYSQYQYENIMLDGVYKDGGFNGRLSMDDANGSVQIDGNFNVAKTIPNRFCSYFVHQCSSSRPFSPCLPLYGTSLSV